MRKIGWALGSLVCAAAVAPAALATASSEVFTFKVPSGPTIRMTVTIPPTNLRVAKIEACRKALRSPPLSYILVTIDNRSGSKEFRLAGAQIVTPSGATVRAADVPTVVTRWPDAKDVKGYNRCNVGLYNAWLNTANVLPGAVSTTVLATPSRLSAVKNIWATPGRPGAGIPLVTKIG